MGNNIVVFDVGRLLDAALERKDRKKALLYIREKRREFKENGPIINPRATDASAIIDGRVVGTCLRKIFLRKMCVMGEPFSGKTLRTFRTGVDTENFDQETIEYLDLKLFSNDKFSFVNPFMEEQSVGCEADTIIKVPDTKYLDKIGVNYNIIDVTHNPDYIQCIPIEHKTMGGNWTAKSKVMGTKTKDGNPKVEHIMQIAIYLDNWAREKSKESDEKYETSIGLLYYRDRDGFSSKVYAVSLVKKGDDRYIFTASFPCTQLYQSFDYPIFREYKGLTMNNIYKRYAKVGKYIKARKLPPGDYDPMFDAAKIAEYTQQGLWGEEGCPSKKIYENYCKGHNAVISDWQCNYGSGCCPYFKFCLSQKRNALKGGTNAK